MTDRERSFMESSAVPGGVDHLIYAAPSLEEGVSRIERLLDMRAIPGGRHPEYGTRNALLALGPETYLEIMAPDPDLVAPPGGRLFALDELDRPRLVAWVLRDEEIERRAERAHSAGWKLGRVKSGFRQRPDGTILSWKLTDPYVMHLDGVVPFLIAWGSTPHPASAAPRAGELVELKIEHPDPAAVRAAFKALGLELRVQPGPQPQLVAIIRAGDRLVELR